MNVQGPLEAAPPANMRDALLVVLTLIATLTFQMNLSPPGGLWQEDGAKGSHTAGEPILQTKHQGLFTGFVILNWLCFYSSIYLIVRLMGSATVHRSRGFRLVFCFCIVLLVLLFLLAQLALKSKAGGLQWVSVVVTVLCMFFLVYTSVREWKDVPSPH